jgi:hypothetical protein
MPSSKSGGKRAVEAKHAERDARRRRGKFAEKAWREKYSKLGPFPKEPEDRFTWAQEFAVLALIEAAADPGPPPEQRREQIIRGVAQLAKVMPAAELAMKLRRYEKAIAELKKPKHGAQVDPRAHGGTRPPASLSS